MTNVFRGRTVLVTGHTGFKGAWLSVWLHELGANVVGFALPPRTERDIFVTSRIQDRIHSEMGDVRDFDALKGVFDRYQPEIIFHLAAQPIVRLSYDQPKPTYDTNVGGTVNLLECCRTTGSVKVVVNVTSDKCYQNNEWVWGYRENDPLGGHDPYSSSKACSEIITAAYRDSFFSQKWLSTVRAGNVIGGGDWQADRLIPDCIRALGAGIPITLRNPKAVRPWQHVLDPLAGYLTLAEAMWNEGARYAGAWNFGPLHSSPTTVEDLVRTVIRRWGSGTFTTQLPLPNQPESRVLSLDASKAVNGLDWRPVLDVEDAVRFTVDWYRNPTPDYRFCVGQIKEYEAKQHGSRYLPSVLQTV